MTELVKAVAEIHNGMPALNTSKQKSTSFFEFWPSWLIYLPVVMQWLLLSLRYRSFTLPLIANPSIHLGGMVGESKIAVLGLMQGKAKKHLAAYVAVLNDVNKTLPSRVAEAVKAMQAKGIEFPVVAKPDLGCRGAGIKIIKDEKKLADYFSSFPAQAKFLLQKKITYEAEAGIFYIRLPGKKQGEIFSITLKYAPYVIGDGKRSLRQLIEDDDRAGKIAGLYFKRHLEMLEMVIPAQQAFRLTFAGNHCLGSIFRDGNKYKTEKMRRVFDAIADDIEGFHYGRFDVRFESIEKLMSGEAFNILEVNGASSEATHIWDRDTSIVEVYKTLFHQYKTLFKIGDSLRQQGCKTPSLWQLLKTWREESKLVRLYPETD